MSAMWNASSLVQDLNSCHRVHFQRRYPLHHGHLVSADWRYGDGWTLGPTLANIFVGFCEANLFSTIDCPPMYYRHVDDTFCLFENEKDVDSFLIQLNSMHSSLKFIVEKEPDHQLAFLDLCIKLLQLFSLLCTESPPFLACIRDGIHFAHSSAKSIYLSHLSIPPLWFHPGVILMKKSSSSSQPCLKMDIHCLF